MTHSFPTRRSSYLDIAVVDRFEVAVVAKAVLDTVQPEPVIAIAARVGPLDDRAATIVVEALPRHPDALHLGGGEGGKVDVDQRARRHVHVEQRTQHFRSPGFGGLERHGVAPSFARATLAQRDRRNARARAPHPLPTGSTTNTIAPE